MDAHTQKHFENWLENHVCDEERECVREHIISLLARDPELLDSHSWPELRDLSD